MSTAAAIPVDPLQWWLRQAVEPEPVLYCSPDARPEGAGTLSDPMPLAVAAQGYRLDSQGYVTWKCAGFDAWAHGKTNPHATLLLMPGVYKGPIEIHISGVVKPAKAGNVVIDGGLSIGALREPFTDPIQGLVVRDLEITSSSKLAAPSQMPAYSGINVYSSRRCRILNCYIHDVGGSNGGLGIGCWEDNDELVIAGCNVQRVGGLIASTSGGLRPTGQGFYVQNRQPFRKALIGNLFGPTWDMAGEVYGSADCSNVTIDGNVFWGPGLYSSQNPRCDVVVSSRHGPDVGNVITNNLFWRSSLGIANQAVNSGSRAVVTGNLLTAPAAPPGTTWNMGAYIEVGTGAKDVLVAPGQTLTLDSGLLPRVMAIKGYEAGAFHILVWHKAGSAVRLDLSPLMKPGQNYRLYDAMRPAVDFAGASTPLTYTAPAQVTTTGDFTVFVLAVS